MEGQNAQSLFEVASVSKVFTTNWAIQKLGPQFQFITNVVVTPLEDNLFDVHIRGSRDPYWGRQQTHFLIAELNRSGIQKIRHLTFDENYQTRWNVLVDFEDTLTPSTDDIAASLVSHIKNLRAEYGVTLREAMRAGVALPPKLNLSLQDAGFIGSSQFQATQNSKVLTIKSAPLYTYLKEMNRVSNNHVADKLFNYLGGTEEFKKFMFQSLGLTNANFQFVNGSGNSVMVGTDANGQQMKDYNKASCETLIEVLIDLRQNLQASANLELKDVMAVSGEESTLNQRYDSIPNTVVAKTGTVDPGIALAGVISTAQGEVYFGYLYKTEGPADWNQAKDQVRDRVFDLIRKFGGRRAFAYTPAPFLSFSSEGSGWGSGSARTPYVLAVRASSPR